MKRSMICSNLFSSSFVVSGRLGARGCGLRGVAPSSLRFSPGGSAHSISPAMIAKAAENMVPSPILTYRPVYTACGFAESRKRVHLLLRLHALGFGGAPAPAAGPAGVKLPEKPRPDRIVGAQGAHLDPVGPEVDHDRRNRQEQVDLVGPALEHAPAAGEGRGHDAQHREER